MKRTVAIVLSLILLGIQAMATVQTSSDFGAQKKSACCSGNVTECCCFTESTSAPQPPPAATAPLAPYNNFTAVLSTLVAWTLPESARSQISSSALATSAAHALPLFTRDCALLI